MYIPQFNYHISLLYPLTQTIKSTLRTLLALTTRNKTLTSTSELGLLFFSRIWDFEVTTDE